MRLLGQDLSVLWNQAQALCQNILSWAAASIPGSLSSATLETTTPSSHSCVLIQSPGGPEKLKLVPLAPNQATIGYNVHGMKPPFATLPDDLDTLPDDLVLVTTRYFSVNFADICARWGLYESALRYVGWPIVVGFDFSGTVQWAGRRSGFNPGDEVFGFTLFGAYSSCILVPSKQIRRVPVLKNTGSALGLDAAAALPAVASTALHAVMLAGGWPQKMKTKNQAVLVHSAAGGVGGMLLQMLKLLGYGPIVAVVGRSHKVQLCKDMGADIVIDKSRCHDIWVEAEAHCPEGFVAIFDANGVETLGPSYEHLCRCGRLITYGFHSNLPKAKTLLSPLEWIRMVYRVTVMPKFNAMSMVTDSKAVLGFNLSFFAEEHEMIAQYFDQILDWIKQGQLQPPPVVMYDLADIGQAHIDIQSGATTGKLVISLSTRNPTPVS